MADCLVLSDDSISLHCFFIVIIIIIFPPALSCLLPITEMREMIPTAIPELLIIKELLCSYFRIKGKKIIAPFVFSFLFCTLNMIHYSCFLHSSSFWSRWWFGGIRWMAQWSRSFWARLDAHEEEIVHHQHFCLLPQQCRKVPRGAGSASPPAPGPSCALSSHSSAGSSLPSSVPFSTPQVTLLSSFELESHTWFSFSWQGHIKCL